MGTFVRYFVVFLFLPGLYLRPDSGATNMRRDRLTRFVPPVHVCTYVCTYVRPSVRPSDRPTVCSFAGPVCSSVRSFVCSFSSIISRRFYIHYNLRDGSGVVIRRATILPRVASREPRVMIMNFSPAADG